MSSKLKPKNPTVLDEQVEVLQVNSHSLQHALNAS